jgi:DNA polymerase
LSNEALAEAPAEPKVLPPSCASSTPRGAFSLQVVREELGDCQRCKLCSTRRNIVFGVGNPEARIMFVGEGPGADEDRLGEPFVGRAGELLTKMINAMGLERSDVYIANVVKCRPPNNRDPEPEEVAACEPFLVRQLEAIQPEIIVTLGKHAAHTILKEKTPITRLRGQWRSYRGTKLMPTLHPAYLLRTPGDKKLVWQDLQAVMQALGMQAPKRGA